MRLEKMMEKFLNKKKKTIIPMSVYEDYISLTRYKMEQKGALETLVREYNSLLEDYFKGMSAKKILDFLGSHEIQASSDKRSKEDLVRLAYEKFHMEYEEAKKESQE